MIMIRIQVDRLTTTQKVQRTPSFLQTDNHFTSSLR